MLASFVEARVRELMVESAVVDSVRVGALGKQRLARHDYCGDRDRGSSSPICLSAV
jgi:hypothetical protein